MTKKSKLVRGIGVNDADYPVYRYEGVGRKKKIVWTCPFYRRWHNMLERCYSEKFLARYPTYTGCKVTQKWHRFSDFKCWMETQDWEGKHLDKDILFPGNKTYGPDVCVFISESLNNFLVSSGAIRGEYPVGVYLYKPNGKFHSRCCNPFTENVDSLGYFSTAEEAHKAWRERKHELACQYADLQSDPRIAEALRRRYNEDRQYQ